MHYKCLLDPGVYIGPHDFPQDKTVQISRVVRESMPARDGAKPEQAPIMYFAVEGKELSRKWKLPKSVLHGLSLQYGAETDAWAGKSITLYAAKCLAFGEVEPCIRIRFPADIEAKIFKWLKKRKANRSTYLITDSADAE